MTKRMRGGATSVTVPAVPSGTVNQDQTSGNYKGLTELAQKQQTQAVYDSATSPSQTAAIQQQQDSLYKSGGARARSKRGGSWPKWGCLSGGKKTKKSKGKTNKKSRKHRRSRRRH